MEVVLDKIAEAELTVANYKGLDRKYQLIQKENAYNNMKNIYKEYSCDIGHKKKSHLPAKYIIMNRVVTPLLIANEKVVELFIKEEDAPIECGEYGHVEVKLQNMTLKDEASEKPLKGQSTSLKVKRSFMEMQKLDSINFDLFPAGVLSAIFTYVDYQSLKQPDLSQYNVIGHFAVMIYGVC